MKIKQHRFKADAIAIGVSTGGPVALHELIPALCARTSLPVFVVQHMPPLFTKSFAEKLDKKSISTVVEASDCKVQSGYVYIAPGGRHMTVEKVNDDFCIRINDGLPENNCKPSVDALFNSVARTYGKKTIAVILTGMGKDGTAGLASLKNAGAYVIAQDRETSVVWGMPGTAVKAGHVDEILPLQQIPERIDALLNRIPDVAGEGEVL